MLSTQRTPAKPAEKPDVIATVDAPIAAQENNVVETPLAPVPPPATLAETQTPGLEMGTDFDFEVPLVHDGVPVPPQYILRKLESRGLTWRWMSLPHVKKAGMRQYTAYSPDAKDREAIDRGDCPPGVSVSAENKVWWGEDAFLATIPRRFFDYRAAERRKRTDAQTKLSQNREVLEAAAARSGVKLSKHSILESRSIRDID